MSEVVFPGDELAIAEEYVPGPGTFESDDGYVVATWTGRAVLDPVEHTARVAPLTSIPCELEPGVLVIGHVLRVSESFVSVEVVARADQPRRAVAGSTNATLHVSKIARGYVESAGDVIQIGDLLRARVMRVKPAVEITMKEPGLGVLKSLCPRCRSGMQAHGEGMTCPECGWKRRGVPAEDYGKGRLIPEAAAVQPQENPR